MHNIVCRVKVGLGFPSSTSRGSCAAPASVNLIFLVQNYFFGFLRCQKLLSHLDWSRHHRLCVVDPVVSIDWTVQPPLLPTGSAPPPLGSAPSSPGPSYTSAQLDFGSTSSILVFRSVLLSK
jgi:hypothetical protein